MVRSFDIENRNKARLTALVLALALLVCHGAMGSIHLVPMETHVAPPAHKETHAHHDAEHGGFLAAHHEAAAVEYFAVLSLFFLAALLFALRPRFEMLPAKVVESRAGDVRFTAPAHLPRGPTLPSLQTFRL
jgi:hypothetical protein